MSSSYWQRQRVGRRRVLGYGATLGAGAAGAAAFGCGDDDDKPATPTKAATSAASASASASASGSAAASASASPAAAAPKPGGTLTANGVGALDAPNQDVHQSGTQLLSSYGIGMAYSRLVRFKIPPETKFGWNAEWAPDLAASAEQPDPTTVVIKLRPNAKFHNIAPVNGRVATAQDVVYSFNRQIQFKVNASLLPPWDAIEAPDATTVRFKLKAPDAEFLPTLALYQNKIIAKEAVDAGKGGDLKEGPTIGTGPFILAEWKSGQSTTLKKNPDFFLPGLPYLDQMVWTRIGDASTSLAAFRSGQVQFIQTGVTWEVVSSVKGDSKIASDSYRQAGTAFLTFKMDDGPMKDARIRQAIYRAVNYDQYIQIPFEGQGYTTVGISMPAADWELPEADLKAIYKQDITTAKQLLSAAGAPSLNIQFGFLNLPPHDKGAQLVQQHLKAAGIESTLVPLDNTGYIANSLAPGGKYPLVLGSLSPSPLPTADLKPKFYTGGSRNASGLSDKDLDARIDKQAQTLNATERKTLLLDLQKYFHGQYYQWSAGQLIPRLRAANLKGTDGAVLSESDMWTRAWLDKA